MTMNSQTGARTTQRFGDSDYMGGLASPYEGFRAWPQTYGGEPVAYDRVPPWIGGGSPPSSSQIGFPSGNVFAPNQSAPYFNDMAGQMWRQDLPPSGPPPYGFMAPDVFPY
jgi:hypothetical protein